MTTIRAVADELRVSISDVKRFLREQFAAVDFSSPDCALTPEHLQRTRSSLLDDLARRRHRSGEIIVAPVARDLPLRPDHLLFTAAMAVAGPPRKGNGARLLVHDDVLTFLGERRGELRRMQAAVQRLMREMLVEGRAQRRVKGTRGPNAGWLRAPLGDNGGYHFYLWHALAGMRSVTGLDLDRREVLVRAIRHHDATDELLDAGARGDYLVLDARAYVEDIEAIAGAADVLSPSQRGACDHGAALTISKGHPGAGKTTLQLERTRRYQGKLLFLTFGEAQRDQAQRWLETYAHDGQDARAWTHQQLFETLDTDWRPAPPLAVAAAELQVALAGDPRALGPWVGHLAALYAELRAHYWGRALPFAFRGAAAAVDDDAIARGYRDRRLAVLGKEATEGALQAARLLPAKVRARLFGDLDRARRLAHDLAATDYPLPAALIDLEALLVDEVQDLTLIELLVCALVARRPLAATGRRPAFHAAGDEGQTVRATDFEWGELKNLINDLLGRPEEFDLPGNLRSPSTITKVINNSWGLYKTMAKSQRPKGYAEAQVDETALGSVLWVDVGEGGLDALCAVVADTPGAVLVYPDTRLPDDVHAAAQRAGVVHVAAAPEVKGLDFRVAFVLDVGRRAQQLYQAVPTSDDGPIVELENRTAVDAVRVAISRATEVLVLVERPLGRDEHARLHTLCSESGALIEGVVNGVSLVELRDRLDIDTQDRNALVTEALADFDRTFADDPTTGLRIIERARGWLGESNRAGAVKGELRRQVYRAVGLSLLRIGIEHDGDQTAGLTRANAELHLAKEPELARLALDARAMLADEGPTRAQLAGLIKHAVGANEQVARYAITALERALRQAIGESPTTIKDWERVLQTLEEAAQVAARSVVVAGLRADLAGRACEWALGQPPTRGHHQLAARALALMSAPEPSLRARIAERQEQWSVAIACHREAGNIADALRIARDHGADPALSLELARATGSASVPVLELLARIHGDVAALTSHDVTDHERQRLTQLIKERLPSRKR